MTNVLVVLGIVALMLYLFNLVTLIPAVVRQWVTAIVALIAVIWGVGVTLGWFGVGWWHHR